MAIFQNTLLMGNLEFHIILVHFKLFQLFKNIKKPMLVQNWFSQPWSRGRVDSENAGNFLSGDKRVFNYQLSKNN